MHNNFINIVEEYKKSETVKVLEYTNKVPELMSISTLVVTKPGGLTTSESLASELPILVINPIPGQEEENAEFLEAHDVAVWLKKDDDPNVVIQNLFKNPEKLKDMKQHTKLLAKKSSTKDICKIIMELI